jgi:peptidoglycan/xylan/chitin deacetylase (PgdA/CDA1 family)
MKKTLVAFSVTLSCLLALSACAQTGGNQERTNALRNSTEHKQTPLGMDQRVKQLQTAQSDTPELSDGSENKVRKPKSLTLIELHKKYSSTFLLNGPTDKKVMALTFDDGPDAKFTPLVLDELKKAGVHATFFVIGNRAEANPEILKRIIKEGHAIGNHSYDHPDLPKLSMEEFQKQITQTDKIIKSYTGYSSSIVRPPYGDISEDQIIWLIGKKKKMIYWNVDSLDWKGLDADAVYANVLGETQPGSIILQHCAGGEGEDLSGSVNAIGSIIANLKKNNISFVTIPEMFDLK